MAIFPPEIPTNVVITPAGTDITVTWDGNATSYQVKYAKSADNIVLGTFAPVTRSQVITGLLNNTGYQIIITNTRDGISYTTEVPYALPTTCAAITNFVASSVTDREVKLTWDAVAGGPLYTVAWFELDKFGGIVHEDHFETLATEYLLSNLEPCKKYLVRVMYECSPEVTITSQKVYISTDAECTASISTT